MFETCPIGCPCLRPADPRRRRASKEGRRSRFALREVRTALRSRCLAAGCAISRRVPTRSGQTKSVTPGSRSSRSWHDELRPHAGGRLCWRDRRAPDRQLLPRSRMRRPSGSGQDHHHREARRCWRARHAAADGEPRHLAARRAALCSERRPGQIQVAYRETTKLLIRRAGDRRCLDAPAGMHIDDELMAEVGGGGDVAAPRETLLGRRPGPVRTQNTPPSKVRRAGRHLGRRAATRMDGDGRGGMPRFRCGPDRVRSVSVGREKLDALEEFHPERVTGRILGMGDTSAWSRRRQETLRPRPPSGMMKRFQKGRST